jgi:uncharacterized membrane protein YeaQ/YmgE (transglycosylase-associated protein family)
VGIIAWIVVGLIAGVLAGYIVKGDEGLGILGRIVLGIVGAVVGGFLAGLVTGGEYINEFNIVTIIVATIGAVIVLIGWNYIRGRQRTGGGVL